MFESHVTVSGISSLHFKNLCKTLRVKPVVIKEDTGSDRAVQMMSAKFHKGLYADCLKEMNDIADQFSNHGAVVIRRKLEKIMKRTEEGLPPNLYREYHLKYEVPFESKEEFKKIVTGAGGHTAINELKPSLVGGFCHIFASIRDEEGFWILKNSLKGFRRINIIREVVVFDDNPDVDNQWAGVCGDCSIKIIDSDYGRDHRVDYFRENREVS